VRLGFQRDKNLKKCPVQFLQLQSGVCQYRPAAPAMCPSLESVSTKKERLRELIVTFGVPVTSRFSACGNLVEKIFAKTHFRVVFQF
jgi:hypothetical protein